jgi:hypothetical protein
MTIEHTDNNSEENGYYKYQCDNKAKHFDIYIIHNWNMFVRTDDRPNTPSYSISIWIEQQFCHTMP